jgi:hypothetical protein
MLSIRKRLSLGEVIKETNTISFVTKKLFTYINEKNVKKHFVKIEYAKNDSLITTHATEKPFNSLSKALTHFNQINLSINPHIKLISTQSTI